MVTSIKEQHGHTTVMVLGISLIICTILLVYSLWVRWDAFTTRSFMEETELKHRARAGVDEGIMLLLADQDPEVDWLGEAWGQGISNDDYTVVITDVGSLLGFNWIESEYWQTLLPAWDAQEIFNYIQEQPKLVLYHELQQQFPILIEAELPLTVFSAFNLNYVNERTLEALWYTAGATSGQARDLANEIVSQRRDGNLSRDDLLRLKSVSHELLNIADWWLVVDGPININTAPHKVLETVLSSKLSADNIITLRTNQAFRSLDDLGQAVDGEIIEQAIITFQSRFFQIISDVGGYKVEAIVARRWNQTDSNWELEIISWIEGGSSE